MLKLIVSDFSRGAKADLTRIFHKSLKDKTPIIYNTQKESSALSPKKIKKWCAYHFPCCMQENERLSYGYQVGIFSSN